jgi:outer membrane protein assembly factor BamA
VVDYNDGRVVTSMVSSGLSLNMVFDDRDSRIYATRGSYALGSFRVSPTWLGSDSEWQSFQTDRTAEAF